MFSKVGLIESSSESSVPVYVRPGMLLSSCSCDFRRLLPHQTQKRGCLRPDRDGLKSCVLLFWHGALSCMFGRLGTSSLAFAGVVVRVRFGNRARIIWTCLARWM